MRNGQTLSKAENESVEMEKTEFSGRKILFFFLVFFLFVSIHFI